MRDNESPTLFQVEGMLGERWRVVLVLHSVPLICLHATNISTFAVKCVRVRTKQQTHMHERPNGCHDSKRGRWEELQVDN